MSNLPQRSLRTKLKRDDVLFFQHIPKTGGLSLIAFLDSQFPSEAIFPLHSGTEEEIAKFTPTQIRQFRLIRGHFSFGPYDNGIYHYITQNPIRITFLREPVARTISAHRHRQRMKEIGQDVTLEQYVSDPQYAKNVVDRQTWMIAGKMKASTQEWTDKQSLPNSEILQVAKETLESMAFVGLMEKFTPSMQLLCHTFDWQMPLEMPQINSSPEPFDPSRISPATLELIKEKTRLDAELYEFAVQLFQQRYAQMIDELVEENYRLRHPDAPPAALLVATVPPPGDALPPAAPPPPPAAPPPQWSGKVIRSVRRRLFPDGTQREQVYTKMRDTIFKRPQPPVRGNTRQ